MRHAPGLPLLLALLSCDSGDPSPTTSPTPATTTESFTFAWPVPCSVLVTKDQSKDGNTGRLRYRLDVSSGKEGELRLRHGDFEWLSINGKELTTDAMRRALAPAMAIAQVVPDLIVDTQGRYLRIEGLDEAIRRIAESVGKLPGRSSEDQARVARSLLTPGMHDLLQQAGSFDWQSWVGAWVHCQADPGEEWVGEASVPFLGAMVPATVTVRHHGSVRGSPGCVRLSSVFRAEGKAATRALAEGVARIAETASARPIDAARLKDIRLEITIEVEIDPRTLQPYRATQSKHAWLFLDGEPAREHFERNAFRFVWRPAAASKR